MTTVTITVTGTNDGPAVADTASTARTHLTVDVIANDTDPDASDTLSTGQFRSLFATGNGNNISISSIVSQTERFSFDPGPTSISWLTDETATVTINYTVTDDDGTRQTDDGTLTITVTGTNDGPVAQADTANTNENGLTVDVIANDTDPDVLRHRPHPIALEAATANGNNISICQRSLRNEISSIQAATSISSQTDETATVTINYTVTDDDGTPKPMTALSPSPSPAPMTGLKSSPSQSPLPLRSQWARLSSQPTATSPGLISISPTPSSSHPPTTTTSAGPMETSMPS